MYKKRSNLLEPNFSVSDLKSKQFGRFFATYSVQSVHAPPKSVSRFPLAGRWGFRKLTEGNSTSGEFPVSPFRDNNAPKGYDDIT
jgi:hypothetical protein